MEEEKWLPVVGYEGLYEVSDFGRVRSLDRQLMFKGRPGTRRGGPKVSRVSTGGYHVIGLGKGGVYSTLKLHRLVARAFLGEPPADKPHVNHIDFVRDNNRVENLEYCSPKENVGHSISAGRMHSRTNPSKVLRVGGVPREKVDAAISLMLSKWGTDMEIEVQCSLPKGYLSRVRRGVSWNTSSGDFPDKLGIRSATRRKLTVASADSVRAGFAAGESVGSLSKAFNVSGVTITSAIRCKTWKTITSPPGPV